MHGIVQNKYLKCEKCCSLVYLQIPIVYKLNYFSGHRQQNISNKVRCNYIALFYKAGRVMGGGGMSRICF